MDRIPELLGEIERLRAILWARLALRVKRDHLVNATSLEHEQWRRAHAEFCRQMGIG